MPTESTLQPLAYTPIQAALVTGRTRTRIFEAIKKKELIALKDGRATLIEATELQRWLRALPTTGRSPAAVA
jgi:excisionase family DNA binding protein